MNEVQRQAYLSALGIENYMPRLVLPSAPLSVRCKLPDNLEVEGHRSPAPVIDNPTPERQGDIKGAGGFSSLEEVAHDSKAGDVLQAFGKAKPVENVKAVVEPQPKVIEDTAPNFALTVWRIESDLMIVDTREVKQALPTDRLLSNILIALGYHLPSLPTPKVLKWPMIDNDFSEQGGEDARNMLHAFLDAQLVLDPVKHLWLLGSAAASYILPAECSYPEVIEGQLVPGGRPEIESLATPVLVTSSLVDMLLNPSLKAQTWRVIHPLMVQR